MGQADHRDAVGRQQVLQPFQKQVVVVNQQHVHSPTSCPVRSGTPVSYTHLAVGQADHVAGDADHQLGVDVDRAEVVDQHGHPQTMIAAQEAVEQRRFARAQKAGQDGQGYSCLLYTSRCV